MYTSFIRKNRMSKKYLTFILLMWTIPWGPRVSFLPWDSLTSTHPWWVHGQPVRGTNLRAMLLARSPCESGAQSLFPELGQASPSLGLIPHRHWGKESGSLRLPSTLPWPMPWSLPSAWVQAFYTRQKTLWLLVLPTLALWKPQDKELNKSLGRKKKGQAPERTITNENLGQQSKKQCFLNHKKRK